MIDPNFLFLSVVASLCFGFIFGYIMRSFIRKNDKSEAQVEIEKALEVETVKKEVRNRHFQEVAQLWRDNRDRSLVFQVENKYYKRGIDLSTKDKELLLKVVMGFYRWLEPNDSALTQDVKPPHPKQLQNNRPGERVQQAQQPPKPSTVLAQGNDKSSPIGLSPVNILTQALQSDMKKATFTNQSMVTQVDAILQKKLDLAGMKKWAIRLTEFPRRGMVVLVGLEQYNGIDEVPYERVRKIIRESVSEWEQRAVTGNFLQ